MNKRELDQLNKALRDLEKKYASINKKSPFNGKDVAEVAKQFDNINDALSSVEISMRGVRAEILESTSGLEGIKDTFKDIGREIGNIDDPLKKMAKSSRKILGLAESLSDIQYDLTKSSLSQVKSLKHKVNLEFRRLAATVQQLQAQLKLNTLTKEERANAEELLALATDAEKVFSEKVGHQDKFNQALKETEKAQRNISRATGLTGKALKGMAGMAEKLGFGDMGDDLQIASDLMSEHAVKLTDNGKKSAGLIGQFKIMATGVASLGGALMKALTDPLVIITMLIKAAKFLLSIFNGMLKSINEIGQSVGLAGDAAKNLRAQMHAIGDEGKSIYYFTAEIAAAYGKLNDAVGFNLAFNKENAKTYQDLTLYMGISEESAAHLFSLSAKMGKPYGEMYDIVRDTTQSLNEQTGYTQDTESMINSIGTASASVKFNIKGGTEGLVKAAHTAARLGVSMNEIAAAAETHLDFESSIQKEIQAEMYLQKDLNLEKLRYSVATGDTAGIAAEQLRLIKENGNELEGNVFKQKAFAAALGMSHEALMKSLNKEKELKGLTGQQLKDKLASAEEMKKQGQEAQAFDRAMMKLMLQLKAALEPLMKKIGPYLITLAEKLPAMLDKIINFAKSPVGKTLLGLGAAVVGFKLASSLIGGLKDMIFGQRGSITNPMFVVQMNSGLNKLQKVTGLGGATWKGNMFKYLGKSGGLSRTMNRTLIKTFGKNGFTKFMSTKVLTPSTLTKTATGYKVLARNTTMLGRGMNNLFAKVIPNSATNLTKAFGTNNMSKISKIASTGLDDAGRVVSKATQLKAVKTVSNFIPKGYKIDAKGRIIQKVDKVADATKVVKGVDATVDVTKATSLWARTTSGLTKTLKVLGPVASVLDLGLGAYVGYEQNQMTNEQKDDANVKKNMSTTESVIVGTLSGDSNTGSFFSEPLGIEKGTVGDEAMGVAGSTTRGALTGASIGAAIGVWFFGVGAAPGAGIGAVIGGAVGAIAEGWKIFTDPDSEMRKGLSKWWDSSKETIGKWASDAGDAISGWASSAGTTISGWASSAGTAISGWASSAGTTISGWASSAGDTISGWATTAGATLSGWGTAISDWSSGAWTSISDFTSNSLDAFGDWSSNALEDVQSWGSDMYAGLTDWTSGAFEDISDWTSSVQSKASSMLDDISDWGSDTYDSASSSVSSAYESSKSTAADIGNSINSFFGGSSNYWAEGGIITKPALGFAGEAGPEAIIPLDRYERNNAALLNANNGGTSNTNSEVISLLKELISEVKKGGDVFMDANKVGHTLALASSKMG